jgi:beta-galactosidase
MGVIAKELVAIVKQNDTTRPVSSGLASVLMSNETGYAAALDAVGYNYQEFRYPQDHKKYPERIIFGSENGMALDAWKAVADNDYVLGQFLWTGIEYLGEAGKFPNRSNTAGVIDLAGNKKTEFYFRQSLWSDKPMVYIGTSDASLKEGPGGLWSHKRAEPVWNWKEGQKVKVHAFSNCDEVELFLNGQSMGIKKMVDFPERVISWDVPFQPGVLKAIARKQGHEETSFELKTAGAPSRLLAQSDTRVLKADHRDVAHIEVNIADEAGNPVYLKDAVITCNINGNARLLGMEDANPENIENYKDNQQMSYHGKMLVYIQSLDKPGKATIRLSSPGLKPVDVELEIQ